ncbi:MAG: TolC family protein [Bacteroidales bacterium]|nr:TolC family protein [Bacteroidales bacterium]
MNRYIEIKNVFAIVILLCGFAVHAQNIPNEYLAEAADNNPGLKSRFSEYMAALERVPQAGALPDPQVTFGYFIQPVETRLGPQKFRISVMQMFPWFGTPGVKEDAATEMARSKYEVFQEAKSRLFYDVKSTWYNLYFTRKAIDIIIENITILNTFRRIALTKLEAGLASAVDVLRAEIEIAELENRLALLRDNYSVMQTGFNNFLNVDDRRSVHIPDSLMNVDIVLSRKALLDSIRNGNHQVLQMEFMEASYEMQEIAAAKAGKPVLSLGIDYMVVDKGENTMNGLSESGRDAVVFPMVGISIPLYRKKYTSMAKEAVLMQESAQTGKLERINLLETTFEKAYKDYRDADRRIILFNNQTKRARQALELLHTAYETDVQNFEELLRMERQLLSYGLELEKAHTDKNAAMAFIYYLMGK